jgi:hypothetical protein
MTRLKILRSAPRWIGLTSLLVSGALFAGVANEAPAPVPDGSLGRALFGDGFGQTSGLKLGGWIEAGYVQNDVVHGSEGLGNGPVILARDTGFQLNQAYVYLEKEIRSDMAPGASNWPS